MDEALIKLAETLDDARLQANTIPSAAHANGLYGEIKNALIDTLNLIVDDYSKSLDVYYSIMADGNTVRQALDAVGGL